MGRSAVVEGFNVGNFFVIPGTPTEAREANTVMAFHEENLSVKMGYELEDAFIAIVGSQFMYRGCGWSMPSFCGSKWGFNK